MNAQFCPQSILGNSESIQFLKNDHVLVCPTTILQEGSQPIMFCQCLKTFLSLSQADCQLFSPLVSGILISRMTGTSLSLTSLPHSGLFHLILPPALPYIPTTVFLVWEKWKDTQIRVKRPWFFYLDLCYSNLFFFVKCCAYLFVKCCAYLARSQ